MLFVAGIMPPGEFFVGINAYVSRGNLVDTMYSGFSKAPSPGAPRKLISPGIRRKVLKWIQNW